MILNSWFPCVNELTPLSLNMKLYFYFDKKIIFYCVTWLHLLFYFKTFCYSCIWVHFMKNFGYEVLEYHWLKERALSEYITWSYKAKAVTISANLNYVQPFPGLLSSFLSSIESKISEQGSQQVATVKSQTKFVNIPSTVFDIIIMWAEMKILKEKTKWTVKVLNGFHA